MKTWTHKVSALSPFIVKKHMTLKEDRNKGEKEQEAL